MEWGQEESKKWVRIPSTTDNKYTHGVLGVVTGSKKYPGAAVLGVQAAHHTGIGMVRYLGDPDVAQSVLYARPETVTAPGKVNAWLIGSGMDLSDIFAPERNRVKKALLTSEPKVIDAGGLDLLESAEGLCVITPHEGELEKLFSRENRDELSWVQNAADVLECVVVLKGHTTYIACPKQKASTRFIALVTSPTTWLATAGTGDVLAGIMGALVAVNKPESLEDLAKISATGVYLHGQAAGLAAANGPFPAQDVALDVSRIISELSR